MARIGVVPQERDPFKQRLKSRTSMAQGALSFDVPYITHLQGNLWIGGCRDRLWLPDYFRSVVSLYPWEQYSVHHPLEAFLAVDAVDADVSLIEDQLDSIADFAFSRISRGNLLVHCQAGLNRSALIVGILLVRMGMRSEGAIQFLREKRSPAVLCNKSFEGWLQKYRG